MGYMGGTLKEFKSIEIAFCAATCTFNEALDKQSACFLLGEDCQYCLKWVMYHLDKLRHMSSGSQS